MTYGVLFNSGPESIGLMTRDFECREQAEALAIDMRVYTGQGVVLDEGQLSALFRESASDE